MSFFDIGNTMKMDQCLEGVFLEASEASTKACDNDSGWYSADTDTSDSRENEISSISSTSSDDNDATDIEKNISYLQEKQYLMKRALTALKEEEVYDASHARAVINSDVMKCSSSIWMEAKEIIEILNRQDDDKTVIIKKFQVEEKERKSKRQKIDLSTVKCISATSFLERPNHVSHCANRARSVPFTGPWMAKALTHCIPSLPLLHDSRRSSTMDELEVVDDPELGVVVMPLSNFQFRNCISLKDAIGFTSVAQLIVLSTPPFLVVHANKAFSIFSGLSNNEVIGNPVERIMEIVQDALAPQATSSSDEVPCTIKSFISSSSKPCQLFVTPITDKLRGGSMSHLLVKVESCDGKQISSSNSSKQSSHPMQQKTIHIQENHPVYGAVG